MGDCGQRLNFESFRLAQLWWHFQPAWPRKFLIFRLHSALKCRLSVNALAAYERVLHVSRRWYPCTATFFVNNSMLAPSSRLSSQVRQIVFGTPLFTQGNKRKVDQATSFLTRSDNCSPRPIDLCH